MGLEGPDSSQVGDVGEIWGFGGGGGGWVGGSVRIVGWIGDLWGFKVLTDHRAWDGF